MTSPASPMFAPLQGPELSSNPALRGFRREVCTASLHRGQLFEDCEAVKFARMEAKKACEPSRKRSRRIR